MKQVTGNDHRVGSGGDDSVDSRPERPGDIGFPLVDAGRCLTMILPDAEMGIGDVGKFHGWRMKRNNLKIKQLRGRQKAYALFSDRNDPMVFTWVPILLPVPGWGISAPILAFSS